MTRKRRAKGKTNKKTKARAMKKASPHGGQIIGDEKAVFIDVYSPATRWILDILDTGQRLPPVGSVD